MTIRTNHKAILELCIHARLDSTANIKTEDSGKNFCLSLSLKEKLVDFFLAESCSFTGCRAAQQ